MGLCLLGEESCTETGGELWVPRPPHVGEKRTTCAVACVIFGTCGLFVLPSSPLLLWDLLFCQSIKEKSEAEEETPLILF